MNRSFLRSSLTTLILFQAAALLGSTARAVSFDEKVRDASAIILGRCTAARSEMDPTGRWIVTYSTFKVEKALKGAHVPEVTIVTPGGRVGSVHQETVGVPSFRQGDERILFITPTERGSSVLFFDQGAYEVKRGIGGEAIIAPVASSLLLMDPQTGRVMQSEDTPRALRRFEDDVRSALSGEVRSRELSRSTAVPVRKGTAEPRSSVRTFVTEHPFLLLLVALGLLLALLPLVRRG
ncbi:MAG TPA: hypothetical protein VMT00_16455 [Thermoanaerobaculia bacterium]|nr:hypothetical protein [Thermoanaerobaculia bacterium]